MAWVKTSGSTGIPLRVATTSATRLFWMRSRCAITCGTVATCAARSARSASSATRKPKDPMACAATPGSPADPLFVTGRSVALHIENDVGTQLAWLAIRN